MRLVNFCKNWPCMVIYFNNCSWDRLLRLTVNCVSHEHPDLKPWFSLVNMLVLYWSAIFCVMVVSFLYMQDMFVLSQLLGRVPVSIDILNIMARGDASSFEHSISMRFGMPSGPGGFARFFCLSILNTY